MNKKDLASLLGCTTQTLSAWIERYDDFPVIDRGSVGRDWAFDAMKVCAFLADRREAEDLAADERSTFLDQFRPTPRGQSAADSGAIKASDLLTLARLRSVQRKEAIDTGQLIPTTDVRIALTTAFAKLNRALTAALQQVARKHALPDATLRDMVAMLHQAQREFVHSAGLSASERDDAPPQNV